MSEKFKDINALIISKVHGFTAQAADTIKKQITKNGGNAEILENSPLQNISTYTHIIVPDAIQKDALQKKLNIKSLRRLKIVKPDWANLSFIYKRVLPIDEYKWEDPELSSKIETTKKAFKRKAEVMEPLPPKKAVKGKTKEKKEPPGTKVENKNENLVSELNKLKKYYESSGDRGRAIAYNKIIRILKMLPYKVTDASQLENIKGIGDKTLRKIDKILKNGYLQRTKKLQQDTHVKSLGELENIFGIGPRKAEELYEKGLRTIDDIKRYNQENPEYFTDNEKVAIDLYDELKFKVPRDEIEEIANIVKEKLKAIDEDAEMEICGSYRRGRELIDDIDVVIASDKTNTLTNLIVELERSGLTKYSFTNAKHKYMGIVKLGDKPHRRFDIFLCTHEEYPFAILYFTGSMDYNILLRSEAKKRGLRLSNTGLWRLSNGKTVVKAKTEDDIIRYLGFEVVSLKERDI
ncbi:unnamed protein product [Blepharisma stoltei]|uniref:DNA polymerase n=1 Tax=Blepharisma stoltei TaxID=1481888 RepID=A0AAU9IHU2_9CILI|nr:unnamed protein product [Blepharisma stoltei]